MNTEADVMYPSDLNELKRVTLEQAKLIAGKNTLTLKRGIDILGELTDLGNVFETIIQMKPVKYSESINTNRKAIKSVVDMLDILKEMHVEGQKPSCLIIFVPERKIVNGVDKIILNIFCDDIATNKMQILRVYVTFSGKYNVLYTIGESIRER